MSGHKLAQMETISDVLQFDRLSARLVSFRSKSAPEQDFIESTAGDPIFTIQYLDGDNRYRQLSSKQAARVEVETGSHGESLAAAFHRIDGFDLDVNVTVIASRTGRFSVWSLSLHNDAGLLITDVQFPFILLRYRLSDRPGSEAVLWPMGPGVLFREPKPQDLQPDHPHTWQLCPENGDCSHYPGYNFAQFLAYYNDRAGVYLACQDSSGFVKQLKPVHREPALRLGISHVGDWPTRGERRLEYPVVLGSFTGDWYAAAELYREWSLHQRWASTPLHRRSDVPAWLLDSPPHVVMRIQGQLDIGPTGPNTEFLPYPKMVPLLETLEKQVEAPLVPVIMSWERPGPWVYPDCFPPAGGADSLREFAGLARERGWHVGTFCNGTRWVTGHYWSGYDGEDYFKEEGGAETVCRTPEGEAWREVWDASWRPSYACCLGVPNTREVAVGFVRRVVDLGLDWVQFFDQNVGVATFPCFAAGHGHPPVPGRWMTEAMRSVLSAFREVRDREKSDGRDVAYSAEGLVSEYFLPDFHVCDVRVVPPGHTPQSWVPLYHFLYHEFIVIQGGFGTGPEPYHMPIRNAYNYVIGEVPGGVMTGNGHLLNYDTWNWAPWEPEVGSNDDSVEMLRAATALRRGAARDFLVYGRMLSPSPVEGVKVMRWQWGGRDHQIPAVFHAAWQAPDGRLGLALANWTTEPQTVGVTDPRLGGRVTLHVSSVLDQSCEREVVIPLQLSLPPLSCTLVESEPARIQGDP